MPGSAVAVAAGRAVGVHGVAVVERRAGVLERALDEGAEGEDDEDDDRRDRGNQQAVLDGRSALVTLDLPGRDPAEVSEHCGDLHGPCGRTGPPSRTRQVPGWLRGIFVRYP